MLGKLVAESGAAQKIATVMMNIFGEKYIQWALMATGFIIGIPLFYNVGFVLMIPLIFSVVYKYKLPALLYRAYPCWPPLSVTHGFLASPSRPGRAGRTVPCGYGPHPHSYGLVIAILTVIIAGRLFSRTLTKIVASPLEGLVAKNKPDDHRYRGRPIVFLLSLLPVLLLMISRTPCCRSFSRRKGACKHILEFFERPGGSSLLLSIGMVATYTLGHTHRYAYKVQPIMDSYGDAVKDIANDPADHRALRERSLKEVFLDSGVKARQHSPFRIADLAQHPLVLGWLIAAIIRVCLGSATKVAGLTAVRASSFP